jgi:hypothetical protein
MKLEFAGQIFSKNTQTLNFMKIYSVGAKMFRADTWKGSEADMMKLKVTFTILQMCLKKHYKSPKTLHCDSEMQMTSVFKQQQFWCKEIGGKHFRTNNRAPSSQNFKPVTAVMPRSYIIKVNTSTLVDFCP